jgi:hypothetical protein
MGHVTFFYNIIFSRAVFVGMSDKAAKTDENGVSGSDKKESLGIALSEKFHKTVKSGETVQDRQLRVINRLTWMIRVLMPRI